MYLYFQLRQGSHKILINARKAFNFDAGIVLSCFKCMHFNFNHENYCWCKQLLHNNCLNLLGINNCFNKNIWAFVKLLIFPLQCLPCTSQRYIFDQFFIDSTCVWFGTLYEIFQYLSELWIRLALIISISIIHICNRSTYTCIWFTTVLNSRLSNTYSINMHKCK